MLQSARRIYVLVDLFPKISHIDFFFFHFQILFVETKTTFESREKNASLSSIFLSTKKHLGLGIYIVDLGKEEYFMHRYSETDKKEYSKWVSCMGYFLQEELGLDSKFVHNTNSYVCTCFGKKTTEHKDRKSMSISTPKEPNIFFFDR